jgi:epoxyqueuosine reductase
LPLTADRIKTQAAALGFDLCGIARTGSLPRLARLAEWLDAGHAGDMDYLERSRDERLDPARVLPNVRSVVAVACLYNVDAPSAIDAREPGRVAISRYAWGDDYHDVMRERLRALTRWLAAEAGPGLEAFSCVDSGPVQERVLAEAAGLGWIGKNTCLINQQLGSWIFLGEVLVNIELEPDLPGIDHCGTCTRCLDACPTGALVAPYVLDSRRCLSYLTIEARGALDDEMRGAIGEQVYGCDICQDVCPWNRRATVSDAPEWQPRDALRYPKLIDLCRLSDDGWRALLKGSAMRRAGVRRIRRSLAYATARLHGEDAAAAREALAAHPSGADADVQTALAWARVGGSAGTTPR